MNLCIKECFLVVGAYGNRLVPHGTFDTRQEALDQASRQIEHFPHSTLYLAKVTMVKDGSD